MAYIDHSIKPNYESSFHKMTVSLPFTYNVTGDVGRGCPNRPDDVMLVQLLLKMIGTVLNPKSHLAGLKIDGIFGHKTSAAIRVAQHSCLHHGEKIALDGRVSRALGAKSPAGHDYFIVQLNCALFDASSPRWNNLPKCVEVPKQLKNAFGLAA